jgi:hypothetical protein
MMSCATQRLLEHRDGYHWAPLTHVVSGTFIRERMKTRRLAVSIAIGERSVGMASLMVGLNMHATSNTGMVKDV